MDNKEGVKENTLEESEIEKELLSLSEKNMLPQQITKKLLTKLKEKKIKLTRTQLNDLVDKISNALKTLPPLKPNGTVDADASKKTKTDEEKDKSTLKLEPTEDLKTLFDSVEDLKKRISELEKNTVTYGKKDNTGRIVMTKDIQTIEQDGKNMEDVFKPLIAIPNDPESIIVLMKWLQYLVDKAGKIHLPEVLSYYVDIGWISDDVRFDLLEYSKGIIEEPSQNDTKRDSYSLSTRDHIQSLLFIQKLKGQQIDDRFMNKIDREMEKISKSLASYPFA
ncbi:MAG: FlaD/FlaE family flagellar protein [Candidatus Thermoplasmatota archaeon]